jgi:hypothetical protein
MILSRIEGENLLKLNMGLAGIYFLIVLFLAFTPKADIYYDTVMMASFALGVFGLVQTIMLYMKVIEVQW